MAYLYLSLAIIFEVAGTTSMKLSEGFSKPLWIVAIVICYTFSLGSLTLSLRSIDLSTAYAIWSGLGTALIVLLGWVVFRERINLLQGISIAMIIAGVVGLHIFGKQS